MKEFAPFEVFIKPEIRTLAPHYYEIDSGKFFSPENHSVNLQ